MGDESTQDHQKGSDRESQEIWVDAVVNTPAPPELTTVGPDFAIIHEGAEARTYQGLEPDSDQELEGFAFRTLAEPGPLLSTFATVNDVHFGEQVCGVIDGSDIGPVFRTAPGDEPYPEVMNRAAVAEIQAIHPDHVLVKGDLTSTGTDEQYEAFRSVYEGAFDGRLSVVRGNHESYNHSDVASEPIQEIPLPGVTLVLMDTSVDGETGGTVTADQLDRIDSIAREATNPVLLFGHHHLGDSNATQKADRTFGIDLDASAAFLAMVAGRPSIKGYFAGHTHRNRVRRFDETGEMPWVEVACVKDYPGAWAQYRVYERGVAQIVHRISSPEALAWTEKTRHMYAGLYHDYAFGSLEDRCFVIATDK